MQHTNRSAGRQTRSQPEPGAFEPGQRPSHHVFAVRQGAQGKGYWTRIGAAWANQDGEGFSIKLDLLPLDGADIVMRTPKDDRDQA